MVRNQTSEYVLINGISQFFLHNPNTSKEVVIMLHGGPGIANSYIAYFHQPHLGSYNVVYYDQRGAGKTRLKNKTKPKDISLEILLEDLKQTVKYIKEKYQTDRIILCGHSWGTQLGTQYVLKYPHDVIGFIGWGPVVSTQTQDRSWYEFLKKEILKSGNKRDIKKVNLINEKFPNVTLEEYLKDYMVLEKFEFKYGYTANPFMPIYRKSPIVTIREFIQMGSAGKFNESLYKLQFEYSIDDVKEYQLPIYYVLGRHDEWTTSTIAAEYFNKIQAPQKGLYWIENAGHMVDTDNPSEFFKAINQIVSEL